MKIELFIFAIAAFFIADTYYEGKYSRILRSGKKYYQMGTIAFLALSPNLFANSSCSSFENFLSLK